MNGRIPLRLAETMKHITGGSNNNNNGDGEEDWKRMGKKTAMEDGGDLSSHPTDSDMDMEEQYRVTEEEEDIAEWMNQQHSQFVPLASKLPFTSMPPSATPTPSSHPSIVTFSNPMSSSFSSDPSSHPSFLLLPPTFRQAVLTRFPSHRRSLSLPSFSTRLPPLPSPSPTPITSSPSHFTSLPASPPSSPPCLKNAGRISKNRSIQNNTVSPSTHLLRILVSSSKYDCFQAYLLAHAGGFSFSPLLTISFCLYLSVISPLPLTSSSKSLEQIGFFRLRSFNPADDDTFFTLFTRAFIRMISLNTTRFILDVRGMVWSLLLHSLLYLFLYLFIHIYFHSITGIYI